MIEDFRLKAFCTIARLGSFTAAARELGITQPAISQQIAELERFAGSKLFERSPRITKLTLKGREMLPFAEEILSSYRKLDSNFRDPESILLRSVTLDKEQRNILIKGNRFADINAPADCPADKIVEAQGLAIIPAFYNTHTHAAMTLLRGYADDMPLQQWLSDYIWPFEDKLTDCDIRQGSDIAVAEMRSSGTVFFSDMYFEIEQTIKAVEQSGIRAAIGITVMDNHSKAVEDAKREFIRDFRDPTGGRIQLVMAPHAIYTVGKEKLIKSAAFARRCGMRIHIHLSETIKEVRDCVREHGMTPVRYLDSIGFLGPDVIAAHCVHVDAAEWKILAKRGVTIAHCPVSNMKLGSGRFPYELALESGCRITLGTDGASSNNSLDMLGEMKTAALLSKVVSANPSASYDGAVFSSNEGNPSLLSAQEVFRMATANGAQAFGIDAGEIANGKLADALLLDLDNPRMQPCHNLISNVVYAADSSVIKNVICNGKIII